MKRRKTLVMRNKEISSKILESIYLSDLLLRVTENEPQINMACETIKKNLTYAFKEIETCRKIIAIGD